MYQRQGLLLDVESFEATLVDATRYLLDDARHAELKSNARESVADKTWHALCEQLMRYYTQAIAGYNRTSVNLFGRSIALPRWVQRARKRRRSASA